MYYCENRFSIDSNVTDMIPSGSLKKGFDSIPPMGW